VITKFSRLHDRETQSIFNPSKIIPYLPGIAQDSNYQGYITNNMLK